MDTFFAGINITLVFLAGLITGQIIAFAILLAEGWKRRGIPVCPDCGNFTVKHKIFCETCGRTDG